MALSVQSTTADRSASSAFEVIPTGAALAAKVRGVDLRYLDDRTFGCLVDAWHRHSVLLVRGQLLSDQDLIAFSRRFGDLDWAPIQENGRRFVEGLPEIYIVSNVKVDGEARGAARRDRQDDREDGTPAGCQRCQSGPCRLSL